MTVFVTRCSRCNEPLEAFEVGDKNWNEGVLWGYLAQKAHDSECPAGSENDA